MKKCVLLHGMYVIGIIQPRQCVFPIRKNKKTKRQTNKQTNKKGCTVPFYGKCFHESRVIAEGKVLLNTLLVQI